MTTPFTYKFGCPSRMGDDFAKKMSSIKSTMDTQRELWNDFCRIESENRAVYRDLVEKRTDGLAEITEKIGRLELRVDALKALPARDRAALKKTRQKIKDLKADLRARRKAGAEAIKPELEKLEDDRRVKVKQAVSDAGLWWCQSEAIIERYDVARSRAMKTGVELRKRETHFNGTMRVRWQHGLPLAVLLKNTDTLAGIQVTNEKRGHAILRICIDSDGRDKTYVEVPFIMHRLIPAGSMVRSVALYPQNSGTVRRWHVMINVQQPTVETGNNQISEIVLTQDWLKDNPAWTESTDHARWLRSVIDKKSHAIYDALLQSPDLSDDDLRCLDEYLEKVGTKRGYFWLRRLVGKVDLVTRFWDETSRMRIESTNLNARAVRARVAHYRILAADLCRANRRIDVARPKMWFAKVGPDRPAGGEFCEILRAAGKRHGCEIVFYVPEQEKDAA